MASLKIKKGDNVVVLTGRDKGKRGEVVEVVPKEGRAFVYHPEVAREDASRSALKNVIDRFFGSKPELLVQNILGGGDIGKKELAKLKKLIAEAK